MFSSGESGRVWSTFERVGGKSHVFEIVSFFEFFLHVGSRCWVRVKCLFRMTGFNVFFSAFGCRCNVAKFYLFSSFFVCVANNLRNLIFSCILTLI